MTVGVRRLHSVPEGLVTDVSKLGALHPPLLAGFRNIFFPIFRAIVVFGNKKGDN